MRQLRILPLTLLVLALLILAACGGNTEESADTSSTDKTQEQSSQESEVDAPADTAESSEQTVLNVWSFTNEIMTMAIAYEGLHPDVDVQYTMIPITAEEYQTKLKAALGTSNAPDMIALEASFVNQFVEADFLADLSEFLPDAVAAQTYPLWLRSAQMMVLSKRTQRFGIVYVDFET
jgi:ABC-type glycerol-3-phosphate transport system substrate-binding protein